MVQSFKNSSLIFLEILFIQYFTIFSCKQYVITDLICIIEKHQYIYIYISIDISQKNAIVLYFERPLK